MAEKNPYMLLDFDPEGSGYDYESAIMAGMKPNPETGHWDGRVPSTGLLLKGKKHSTWNALEQGEKDAGYEIYQGEDKRYYSRPKTPPVTWPMPSLIPFMKSQTPLKSLKNGGTVNPYLEDEDTTNFLGEETYRNVPLGSVMPISNKPVPFIPREETPALSPKPFLSLSPPGPYDLRNIQRTDADLSQFNPVAGTPPATWEGSAVPPQPVIPRKEPGLYALNPPSLGQRISEAGENFITGMIPGYRIMTGEVPPLSEEAMMEGPSLIAGGALGGAILGTAARVAPKVGTALKRVPGEITKANKALGESGKVAPFSRPQYAKYADQVEKIVQEKGYPPIGEWAESTPSLRLAGKTAREIEAMKEFPADFPFKVNKTTNQVVGAPKGMDAYWKYLDWQDYMTNLIREGEAAKYWYTNSAMGVTGHVGDVETAKRYLAALAGTSPRITVSENLQSVENIYKQAQAGKPLNQARVAGMPKNLVRGTKAWKTGTAAGMGQKVEPFGVDLIRETEPHLKGEVPGIGINDIHAVNAARYTKKTKGGEIVPLDAPNPIQNQFMKQNWDTFSKELGLSPEQVQSAAWAAWKLRMDRAIEDMMWGAREAKQPLLQQMLGNVSKGKHEIYEASNITELARSYTPESMWDYFVNQKGGVSPDYSHYLVQRGYEKDYQKLMNRGREITIQNVPKTNYQEIPLADREKLMTVIHFGRDMEGRPTGSITMENLARLNGAKTANELRSYSGEIARTMEQAELLKIPFHPKINTFGPRNITRESKVTMGKTPYNIVVRESEIYDGFNDPLGLWKQAAQMTENHYGRRAAFENLVHERGFGGYRGQMGEDPFDYDVFLWGEWHGIPPKEYTIGVSQQVQGVGKQPKSLAETRKAGQQQYSQFLKDVQATQTKWPEIKVDLRSGNGNYYKGSESAYQFEPSVSFNVTGPEKSVEAFASYLGLTKNQNSVLIIPKEVNEANGILIKFKLKGTPDEIQKGAAAKKIGEYNIKEYPDGLYVEHFVFGGDQTEISKLADFYWGYGDRNTPFDGNFAEFRLIDKTSHKEKIMNFFGQEGGEGIYGEAAQKGLDWIESLRKPKVSTGSK